MQIKKAPVKDLVSPEWNPRQITDEDFEKLKTSLEEFGYIEPIIINDVNNHVVGGNQRLRALIALGYDEVDVVYVHIEDINKENTFERTTGNPTAPSPYSLEERLQRALNHIDKHGFITLQEYANLNHLNYSTASRELAKLVLDPNSGIKAKGAASHKVWVRS
jgi:hypothetical protein